MSSGKTGSTRSLSWLLRMTRVSRFRHPIPSEKPVEKYLMVSVNARKWGLIVSLTRFVYLGKVPEELREKYLANVYIDCVFMAASRPGTPARDVLQKGLDAYREKGYPEEWRLHHQGGSIGYTGRDYRTNFNTPDIIQESPGLHLESLDHGHQVGGHHSRHLQGARNDHPTDALSQGFRERGRGFLRASGHPGKVITVCGARHGKG